MLHALTELSKTVRYIKQETEWDEKGEFQSEENKLRSKHPTWNRSSSQHMGEKRQGQCMVTMTAARLTLNSLIIAVVTMTGFKSPWESHLLYHLFAQVWFGTWALPPLPSFPQCPLLHFQLWRSTCFSFSINAVYSHFRVYLKPLLHKIYLLIAAYPTVVFIQNSVVERLLVCGQHHWL